MVVKTQQISIPSILKIGSGEINNLGKYLKENNFPEIACFFSEGIEELFGEEISKSLKEADIKILHKNVISDISIENIMHNAFEIPKKVDALIGIGGGKALDYAKYCAHVLKLPFISIPTSTSNDGFCSPNSSLLVQGKRKSVHASIPYGVIVDIDIIKSSPDSCIYSGIGDLISKITAEWDWQEATKRGEQNFNDFGYLISQNSVMDFLCYQSIQIKEEKFLYNLVVALLMNGLSMEIAGSSRPASGSEHLISHTLDKIAKNPQMHGLQVGIATYLCSYLQNNQFDVVKKFLCSTKFFDFVQQNPLDKEDFINAVKQARCAKEDFYTILSEDKMIEKAIKFINTDEILNKLLK
ncbi:MAG: iron-containing alcohol dehydrogenase family protein [Candidatus Gastranaerophilales bacterium]|nr:iron-containing alcohol dehydrogenase family protein [Candidatus Gastranaerophilales bacterium]